MYWLDDCGMSYDRIHSNRANQGNELSFVCKVGLHHSIAIRPIAHGYNWPWLEIQRPIQGSILDLEDLSVPHRPTQSSGLNFGDLHKKTISQPYKIVGLKGYKPSQPWSATAAAARLNLGLLDEIPPFPTLQELDNEFDGWPESGNPFVNQEVITPAEPVEHGILALPTSSKTKATKVADLIRSEDKLYFIAYSQERIQARKEWKLVHVNFQKSLQQHPSCLQDGRFSTDNTG
jgi:hypothetical protein